MSDHIRTERHGEVATVVLDRPAKLNAIGCAMWDRLAAVFAELDADESLRCVVVAGGGERAFSVGADIAEFEATRSTVELARAYAARTHGALQRIARCRHPVVAAIRGLCVGGGLELATCCDLRIAGEGARFGIPIKRLGLVVAHSELQPLLRLVGPANALEILLEGEVFGAGRAAAMGLVNRVVPDDALEAEVAATAERIADGAPLVARWHKAFTRRLLDPTPLTPEELDESYHCFGTEDFRAGYQAFLAKTRPTFRGR
jgi:enoyl-CoA hydratase